MKSKGRQVSGGPANTGGKGGRNDRAAGLAVRQKAAMVLDRVLGGEPFEPLGCHDIADGRDRALANRLVTLALRRHGHLNHVIGSLLERGMPRRSGRFEAILRIGLTQLLFLPESGEHSAIHLAVECVRRDRRGGRYARLMNGVLRQAQRERDHWKNLGMDMLFPPWIADKWAGEYGAGSLERFGEALLRGATLDLTLKERDPGLIRKLGAEPTLHDSVRVDVRDRPVVRLPGYGEGKWWVQDVAAAIPARLFRLQDIAAIRVPRVLDMCAAPGGKTAQMAKEGYSVTALDNSPGRLQRLRENLERLDYPARILEADGSKFVAEEKFDGILIDAPCTASGVFRRHPEVLWQRGRKDLENRVSLQRELIVNATRSLAGGGQLIYCVCSLHGEEGEEQAGWVSRNLPRLKIHPVEKDEIPGLEGAVNERGWLRTRTGLALAGVEDAAMDGFFIIRWIFE